MTLVIRDQGAEKGLGRRPGNFLKRKREEAAYGTERGNLRGQGAGDKGASLSRAGENPESSRGRRDQNEIRTKKEHQDRALRLRTDALKCAVRDSNPGHPD